jgi:Mn-dependent DtxR family transcriptional regulator
MSQLTKTHIAILEALSQAEGTVHANALGDLPVKGKAREKQIAHLAEQGLLVSGEDGVRLTDIGRAALAPPETPAETQAEAPPPTPADPSQPAAKKTRKKDQLIALLQAEAGATVPDIAAALGWQPHTTRAALTGLKKAGHTIDKLPPLQGSRSSRYKLVETA